MKKVSDLKTRPGGRVFKRWQDGVVIPGPERPREDPKGCEAQPGIHGVAADKPHYRSHTVDGLCTPSAPDQLAAARCPG
jgi:hypothetical protein